MHRWMKRQETNDALTAGSTGRIMAEVDIAPPKRIIALYRRMPVKCFRFQAGV